MQTTKDNPNSITIQQLQQAMTKDDNIQQLKEHNIRDWCQMI